MTRTRVDEAAGESAVEDVIEAGLIAADAGVDLVAASGGGLAHELRVGQERTGHRDHVGVAARQHLFGDFWRVDAVGGDDVHGQFGTELRRHPGESGPWYLRGDGGNRDIEKGLKLLNELADLAEDNREASGEALRFLSIYYIMGQNFSPDIAIGRKYAIQGSEICVGSTMSIMAMSYLQENPPNYFMAYAWANVAINHSNEQFRNAAVKIRESTRVNLTQNQMISAEAASKKFPVCTK